MYRTPHGSLRGVSVRQISTEDTVAHHSKGSASSVTGKGSEYSATPRRCGWFHFIWSETMSQDRRGYCWALKCKRQPSHLEVTEWDLYQPALDILAVVFYTFIRRKRRRRRRRSAKEGRCGSEKEKEFCLLPCAFYEKLEQTSLDSPLADQAPTAIGYLWFPSRGRARAWTCIKIQLYTHANKSF